MVIHVIMMILWLFTTVYGGVIIYQAIKPELTRVQMRVYIQPELGISLVRQERMLTAAGIGATILWGAVLAATLWCIIAETAVSCRLYLC